MATTRCPDANTLERFLLGPVTVEQAETPDAHLASCPECVRSLRGVRAVDGLVSARTTPVSVETSQVIDNSNSTARATWGVGLSLSTR